MKKTPLSDISTAGAVLDQSDDRDAQSHRLLYAAGEP